MPWPSLQDKWTAGPPKTGTSRSRPLLSMSASVDSQTSTLRCWDRLQVDSKRKSKEVGGLWDEDAVIRAAARWQGSPGMLQQQALWPTGVVTPWVATKERPTPEDATAADRDRATLIRHHQTSDSSLMVGSSPWQRSGQEPADKLLLAFSI